MSIKLFPGESSTIKVTATVSQLIKQLEEMPPDAEVYVIGLFGRLPPHVVRAKENGSVLIGGLVTATTRKSPDQQQQPVRLLDRPMPEDLTDLIGAARDQYISEKKGIKKS